MKRVHVSLSGSLSPLQKEYRSFVKSFLKERGLESPFGEVDTADLLAELSNAWDNHKQANGLKTKAEEGGE